MPEYAIFCLFLDRDSKQLGDIFEVEISPDASVSKLQQTIKTTTDPFIRHIDADQLTLWKLSEPLTDVTRAERDQELKKIKFPDPDSDEANGNGLVQFLRPLQTLSNYWTTAPKPGHLHILVHVPPDSETGDERAKKKQKLSSDGEWDKLTELRVKNISKHLRIAPSSGAVPSTFMKEQKSNPIAIGRPKNPDFYHVPLSLFHAEFAQFKKDIVSGPLERELSPLAYKWSWELSNFFEDEAKREAKFHELLSELFGSKVTKQKTGSFETNGGINSSGLVVKPILVETKNEATVGSSDAFLEIVLYHLERIRAIFGDKSCEGDWTKTRIPSLLIVHNGPNIQVLGAVCLSDQYIEVLSPSLPLYFNEYDTLAMDNLLRFITALRRLFLSLSAVYEKPNDYVVDPSQIDFPYPRSYESSTGSSVQFTYVKRINDIRLVFTARTEDKNIIVKFGRGRYGHKAHRAAAQSHLAPALLSYSVLADEWWMVVMEPLQDGFKPCNEYKYLDQSCMDAITSSVEKLHKLGFVHGDLRDTNVFVRKHQDQWECQIIDYDWSEQPGHAVYPTGVFNNGDVWRPDRYMDGLNITLEHDISTLNEFFRRRRRTEMS